ncbi:MAG: peptidylprolyl isomerase [Lachnospiraceae bacterium]|nr:peptidylprolyl isomerase [Lachnospiraceae bacterium]
MFNINIKKYIAAALGILLVFLYPLSLTGCGTKVVLTTGFGKDEVFRLSDRSCYLPEIMVYLTDIQNQYESVYGSGIWSASLSGVSLEENVKDTVLAKIAQVKTMYLIAQAKQIVLTPEEEMLADKCAEEYYSLLSDPEREYLGVNKELLTKMYCEYALADKVVYKLIEDINPEISDDEARTIVLQHIFISTGATDGAGNFVSYDPDEKASRYKTATEIRQQAIDGEDFEALAAKYSEESEITLSLERGAMEKTIEDVTFGLETGEISEVITNDSGYHIFKCISTLDRAQTDLNKERLVEERRQKAFADEYNTFVAGIVKNLNEELWDSIELSEDIQISADFFGIYDSYFAK